MHCEGQMNQIDVDSAGRRLYGASIQWHVSAIETGRIDMRHLVLAIIMAAGVSLFGAAGASAAPASGHAMAQAADHASNTIEVRGGCGRGWHRGPHGHCRRNW